MIHKDIRTYTYSENAFSYSGFAFKRMEDIYLNANGVPDNPHRHDYYTIIFIERGEGFHFVDFYEYKIENQTLFFIQQGQMHQLVLSSKPVGWVITFTEEFLLSNSIPEKLINYIYLFNDYGQSPPLSIEDEDLPVYQNLIAQMVHFAVSLEKYKQEAIGSLVKIFIIQSNNHCSLKISNNP